MSDKHANFTPELKNINNNITPFRLQLLANFPFIEADFDALTVQQLLAKVVEYLNQVIGNSNNVSSEVLALYSAYQSLETYVNTYFDDMEVINFELVKTEGLVKTYRVTFYNKNSYEFSVSDGKAVVSIEQTNFDKSSLTHTYKVSYNDGSFIMLDIKDGNGIKTWNQTQSGIDWIVNIEFENGDTRTFKITNGDGIESIEKIATNGLIDTYRITYTSLKTQDFYVTNGAEGPQGPQGEIGPQGPQGEIGPANTLRIGTVTNGKTASATITGEAPNQVLNLVLPEGPQGPQGQTGPQGPAGDVGQFSKLSIGTVTSGDSASASITGEAPNQVLNLVLPQGPQGPQGQIGPQGPQGEIGPQGPQGEIGPQGPAGSIAETVLYEGSDKVTSVTLSETYKNFKVVDIYYRDDQLNFCSASLYINNNSSFMSAKATNESAYKKSGGSGINITHELAIFAFDNNVTITVNKYIKTQTSENYYESNDGVKILAVIGRN